MTPYYMLLVVIGVVCAQNTVEQSDDGNSGTIKFSTPDLHDDEAHSPWMPDQLRCDACKAVVYQLYKRFQTFNRKRKSLNYNIPESEVLDIFEATCDDGHPWEGYGLKSVNKVNRLSGEGTEVEKVPGITAGGGKWPSRLQDMCQQYAGDIGELTIYNQYKKKPNTQNALEDFMCRGTGIRADCNTVESKDEL